MSSSCYPPGWPTLAMSAAQFRAVKPAFGDPNQYPDGMIEYWLAIASIMLNQRRWGTSYLFGTTLFVAHNCALEYQQNLTVASGGIPGTSRGPISSETPGSVALSYAVSEATEKGGGAYNLTTYGTQFIRYARMMGAGPIQIGVGCAPLFSLANGIAWNGPWNGPEGPGWGT